VGQLGIRAICDAIAPESGWTHDTIELRGKAFNASYSYRTFDGLVMHSVSSGKNLRRGVDWEVIKFCLELISLAKIFSCLP